MNISVNILLFLGCPIGCWLTQNNLKATVVFSCKDQRRWAVETQSDEVHLFLCVYVAIRFLFARVGPQQVDCTVRWCDVNVISYSAFFPQDGRRAVWVCCQPGSKSNDKNILPAHYLLLWPCPSPYTTPCFQEGHVSWLTEIGAGLHILRNILSACLCDMHQVQECPRIYLI